MDIIKENYVPAKWWWNKDERELGNINMPPYVNGRLSKLFIDRQSNCILIDNNGKINPVIKILDDNGYYRIKVLESDQEKFKDYGCFPVHQIVQYTFFGLPPEDLIENQSYSTDHIDNDKRNNSADNLEYLDYIDNRLKRRINNDDGRNLLRKNFGYFTYSGLDKKKFHEKVKKDQKNYIDALYAEGLEDLEYEYYEEENEMCSYIVEFTGTLMNGRENTNRVVTIGAEFEDTASAISWIINTVRTNYYNRTCINVDVSGTPWIVRENGEEITDQFNVITIDRWEINEAC